MALYGSAVTSSRYKTWADLKAGYVDDRAKKTAKCVHNWIRHEVPSGITVRCANCGKRPYCAPSVFDTRRRQASTHAQGESAETAKMKAALCRWLERSDEYPPIEQCRYCGFWTI